MTTMEIAPRVVLTDVVSSTILAEMIKEGYVRSQRHPERDLVIYNYTETCQFAGEWNEVTLACRGLIATGDGTVVARPFRKFFNYGQVETGPLDLHAPASVTDKADGSLGILYPLGDSFAVATRGSFASDQAAHATRVWRSRYAERFTPPPGLTLLFEIIYPTNRVVIDYGDLDDLVLLGAVDIATGVSVPAEDIEGWPGPIVDRFEYRSLAEALEAPPRDNREGMVIHLLDGDVRVKVKYDEYVRLHRIVTGLNARVVWEHLVAGRDVAELAEGLPDEFHPWVREVAATLHELVEGQVESAVAAYNRVVIVVGAGSRKDFALHVATRPDKALLFKLLDGRDIRPMLWQRAKPAADWTPSGRTFSSEAD